MPSTRGTCTLRHAHTHRTRVSGTNLHRICGGSCWELLPLFPCPIHLWGICQVLPWVLWGVGAVGRHSPLRLLVGAGAHVGCVEEWVGVEELLQLLLLLLLHARAAFLLLIFILILLFLLILLFHAGWWARVQGLLGYLHGVLEVQHTLLDLGQAGL